MKMTGFFIVAVLLLQSACVTTKDAGRAYFQEGAKVKGVEPAEDYLARMEKDRQLFLSIYGQSKAEKIIQCTLLRNQLYVAAMRSSDKEILEEVKLMEAAYQESDATFLSTCDQIKSTPTGKIFLGVQREYLMRKN